MTTPGEVADQFLADAADIDRELAEIDMLIAQARSETSRHETRRATAADKLAGLDPAATAADAAELAGQVVNLTRRAALMDAQLEILEGKRRSAARLQEVIRASAEAVRGLELGTARRSTSVEVDEVEAAMPPAVSGLVLSAQEDLRREIARAMHDGPAQSLTNIVLQAEIVERLVARDPTSAAAEVRALVAMVQQTLEATKTFIFDVRPMVLDDLGLVPTLRRSARDRGRRAGIDVAFASAGVDRAPQRRPRDRRLPDRRRSTCCVPRGEADSRLTDDRLERRARDRGPSRGPRAGRNAARDPRRRTTPCLRRCRRWWPTGASSALRWWRRLGSRSR